jgi:hypothetical protein
MQYATTAAAIGRAWNGQTKPPSDPPSSKCAKPAAKVAGENAAGLFNDGPQAPRRLRIDQRRHPDRAGGDQQRRVASEQQHRSHDDDEKWWGQCPVAGNCWTNRQRGGDDRRQHQACEFNPEIGLGPSAIAESRGEANGRHGVREDTWV